MNTLGCSNKLTASSEMCLRNSQVQFSVFSTDKADLELETRYHVPTHNVDSSFTQHDAQVRLAKREGKNKNKKKEASAAVSPHQHPSPAIRTAVGDNFQPTVILSYFKHNCSKH